MVKGEKPKKAKELAPKGPKEPKEHQPLKAPAQSIVIAVLATVLVCLLLTMGVLFATGTIKFSSRDVSNESVLNESQAAAPNTPTPNDAQPNSTTVTKDTCYDETRVQVSNLEFCLPDDFIAGGKSGDGAYVYNLIDDDGRADVKVYNLKIDRTPTQFINSLSPDLKVVDQNYIINDVSWVRAESGKHVLALATKSGDQLYAVLFTITRGDGDAYEAWRMIPATLYLTK